MTVNTTDQNDKLQQTNEQLRTRNNLSNIINQDVFGVLNAERKIVIDNNSLVQLGNLNTNINYAAQVTALTTQIATIDAQIGSAVPPYTGLNLLLDVQRRRDAVSEAAALQSAGNITAAQVPATITNINNDINSKKTDINNQIAALTNQRAPLDAQRVEYQNIITTYGTILTLRQGELTTLTAAANNFDITNQLPNSPVINYRGDCDFGGVNTTDLETAFRGTGTLPIAYNLCDNTSGAPLAGNAARGWQVTTAGGQVVTLRGLTITGTVLMGHNITVDPVEGLTFPLNLEIGVRGRISQNTINLDNYKTLRLTINAPQLSQAQRELVYDNLNVGGTIDSRINIEHTNNNTVREDAVLREMLSAGGNQAEVTALRSNEAQAREFIKRIRAIPGLIPVVPIPQVTNPAGFRRTMADTTRNVPVQHLVSDLAFADYLRNNLDANIQDYLRRNIRTTLDNAANRNTILREFLDFQTELKNNKLDSNIDQNSYADLNGIEMQSRRDLRLLGRNDNNYMRFFSGSNIDLGDQTVELNTPLKYTMKLKVSGKNQLSAMVKIGTAKEREYKAGDPMSLMQKILSEKTIPDGKTRAHIAYNVAKGMIQKAKDEDISLSYRDDRGHNMVINMDGQNIVLEDQDDRTNHGTTNRRITETLFDHSLFESTNSRDNPNRSGRHVLAPDNRTLRVGIERLTRHFNLAMNNLNANYNCATQRRMLGLLRSNTSSDFPTSAWTSPIKKLMNLRTTTNFDFSTSVSHNGKTVQIERKKNTFFLTIDGVELKGKDLGKLLNKRKGGIRLFDGIERAVCGEIYKSMVEKLRTNTKIARSNFGVMDPRTGRMYILDEDGQLGYLRAEEAEIESANLHRAPGVNTIVNGAAIGGLTAAGIATGGAAALAAGLSWGAAGTAVSWGAIAAPGTALFKDIRRITGTGYGTLRHSPAARTMCDEAETREVYKDPFLMGKLMKVMNLRLGQF